MKLAHYFDGYLDGWLFGQARWWLLFSLLFTVVFYNKEMYSKAAVCCIISLTCAFFVGKGYGMMWGLFYNKKIAGFNALQLEEKDD